MDDKRSRLLRLHTRRSSDRGRRRTGIEHERAFLRFLPEAARRNLPEARSYSEGEIKLGWTAEFSAIEAAGSGAGTPASSGGSAYRITPR
jgi:hypothetical protein